MAGVLVGEDAVEVFVSRNVLWDTVVMNLERVEPVDTGLVEEDREVVGTEESLVVLDGAPVGGFDDTVGFSKGPLSGEAASSAVMMSHVGTLRGNTVSVQSTDSMPNSDPRGICQIIKS